MIKFFCRKCGCELWRGAFENMVMGKTWGETIDELWKSLWCTDCWLKTMDERK